MVEVGAAAAAAAAVVVVVVIGAGALQYRWSYKDEVVRILELEAQKSKRQGLRVGVRGSGLKL